MLPVLVILSQTVTRKCGAGKGRPWGEGNGHEEALKEKLKRLGVSEKQS